MIEPIPTPATLPVPVEESLREESGHGDPPPKDPPKPVGE